MTKAQGSRTPLTREMIQQIRLERGRTRTGAAKLLSHRDDAPDGLYYQTVQSWLDGTPRTVIPEHWEYVIKAYRELESVDLPNEGMKHDTEAWRGGRWGKDLYTITEDDKQLLKNELKRTGTTWRALLNIMGRPEGWNSTKLSNVINGRLKSCDKDQLQAVFDALASIPSRQS